MPDRPLPRPVVACYTAVSWMHLETRIVAIFAVLSIKFLSSVAANSVPLADSVAATQVQLLQELARCSDNVVQSATIAFFTLRA